MLGNPVTMLPNPSGRRAARSCWTYAGGARVEIGDQAAKAKVFDKMVENLSDSDLRLLEVAISGRRTYDLARLRSALPEPPRLGGSPQGSPTFADWDWQRGDSPPAYVAALSAALLDEQLRRPLPTGFVPFDNETGEVLQPLQKAEEGPAR